MKEQIKTICYPLIFLLLTFLFATIYEYFQNIIFSLLIVGLSIVCLSKTADAFIGVSIQIGESLGLSGLGTGAIIVAIGTSAPEFVSSISAAIKNQPSMVIGNVYGTIIANTLLGIGIAAVISKRSLIIHPRIISTQLPVFFGSIVLSFAALYNGRIDRLESVLLLLIFCFYLVHVYRSALIDFVHEKRNTADYQAGSIYLGAVFLVLLAVLFVSGNFAVEGILYIAEDLNISSDKLATSVLAIGTSIPEIFTAISFVKKNEIDGLFGEVIGSNIFDVLGIFGVSSILVPLTMKGSLLIFLVASVSVMFFQISIMSRDKKIERTEGALMLALFFEFIYILKDL